MKNFQRLECSYFRDNTNLPDECGGCVFNNEEFAQKMVPYLVSVSAGNKESIFYTANPFAKFCVGPIDGDDGLRILQYCPIEEYLYNFLKIVLIAPPEILEAIKKILSSEHQNVFEIKQVGKNRTLIRIPKKFTPPAELIEKSNE